MLELDKRRFKNELTGFYLFLVNNKILIFFTLFVAILCYGFELSHFTLSIDEEIALFQGNRYRSIAFAEQGRFGIFLIKSIFPSGAFSPFANTFLSISILGFSALTWSYLFHSIIKDKKYNTISFLLFIGIYLSYPVYAHFISFSTCNFEISLGLLLLSIGIFSILKWCIFNYDYKYLLFGILLSAFSFSIYEAFVSVFIVSVLSIMFVFLIDGKLNGIKFKNKYILFVLIKFIFSFLISLFFYFIVLKSINFFIPSSGYTEGFMNITSMSYLISNFLMYYNKIFFQNYIYGGNLLVISFFPLLLILIFLLVKFKRENIIWLVFIGFSLFLSPFSLLLLGINIPLRALQGLPLMIAIIWFSFFLIMNVKFKSKIGTILLILILIYHSQYLNKLFYGDYRRFQEDIAFGHKISNYIIEKNDNIIPAKPIIFLGSHSPSSNDIIVNEIIGTSFFEHNQGNTWRMLYFLNHLGYNFKKPSRKDADLAKEYSKYLNSFPNNNSLIILDSIIIVKLSNSK